MRKILSAIILSIPFSASSDLLIKENSGTVEITQKIKKSSAKKHKFSAINPKIYDSIIETEAAECMLDPLLIKSIIRIESGFNPKAVSAKGAMGLMQLMPATAKIYGLTDPFDPRQNIRAGTKHFACLMDEFGNDVIMALAAYHAGSSRVRKAGGVPPIRETIGYVRAVLSKYEPRSSAEIEISVKKLYTEINDGTLKIHD